MHLRRANCLNEKLLVPQAQASPVLVVFDQCTPLQKRHACIAQMALINCSNAELSKMLVSRLEKVLFRRNSCVSIVCRPPIL